MDHGGSSKNHGGFPTRHYSERYYMDNGVIFCGNVTADPTIRYTDGGIPVTSFDIAVNRRWTDPQSQEQREDTMFVGVQCWRQLAENAAESISKGQRVVITGRMEQNSWEADDGTARSKHRVVAQDVGQSMLFGTTTFTKVDRRKGAGAPAAAETASPSAQAAGDGEEPF